MFVSLRSIPDHEILSRTSALVAQERKLTLSLLLHLNEVERRKLHLKGGHATLFAYCTSALGYSASAAMRRIQAARCIARFPGVHGLLESNQVNLSMLSRVASILTPENNAAILSRICGKSQREVEAVVAEYQPLATVPRDRVRTVVVRVPLELTVAPNCRNGNKPEPGGAGTSGTGIAELDYRNDNKPEIAEAALSIPQAQPSHSAPAKEKTHKRAVIQFSAGEAFMDKMERVRSIAAHRLPANASFEAGLRSDDGSFHRARGSECASRTPPGAKTESTTGDRRASHAEERAAGEKPGVAAQHPGPGPGRGIRARQAAVHIRELGRPALRVRTRAADRSHPTRCARWSEHRR
jgi:hypothetical protein